MGFVRVDGGWRYNFGGLKTNTAADEMPPTKYPYAKNVRYVKSLQTRPGYELMFDTNQESVVLSVQQSGVEVFSVSVSASDPLYIASGFSGCLGVQRADNADWNYDNFANGDGTTDLFTDDFNRANSPNLGVNWIQDNVGGLFSTYRINSNRLRNPTKNATVADTPIELITPTVTTAIVDQHMSLRFRLGNDGNPSPTRGVLRGNGTTIANWIGYCLIKTLTTFPNWTATIIHLDVATATQNVIGTSGEIIGATGDEDIKFLALQA